MDYGGNAVMGLACLDGHRSELVICVDQGVRVENGVCGPRPGTITVDAGGSRGLEAMFRCYSYKYLSTSRTAHSVAAPLGPSMNARRQRENRKGRKARAREGATKK